MRSYRGVLSSIRNQTPQLDTATGERAYARTLVAPRVRGRRAPSTPCTAVRRCPPTDQSSSMRSFPSLFRWCLSGDPRRRSSPGNTFAAPNARARVRGAADADEGEAKQTSASRSGEDDLPNTSVQLISILCPIAAVDRPAIGEERDLMGVLLLPFGLCVCWGLGGRGGRRSGGCRLVIWEGCAAKSSVRRKEDRRVLRRPRGTGHGSSSGGPDGPASFVRHCYC
jgi:hypothetical protein